MLSKQRQGEIANALCGLFLSYPGVEAAEVLRNERPSIAKDIGCTEDELREFMRTHVGDLIMRHTTLRMNNHALGLPSAHPELP